MFANISLPIPELGDFDLEELNINPVLNEHQPVPLIGGILVANGLITREQLNACLLLQAQDHPNLSIGQILVRCGYITQPALDRALGLQSELRSSLVETIEEQGPPPDVRALVLHTYADALSGAVLRQLGVATTVVHSWPAFARALDNRPFDMALAGGECFDQQTVLPDQSVPLLILPPIAPVASDGFDCPQWARSMIGRFVAQIRAQRLQRETIERLHQREFELSAVAAMSRGFGTADTPRAAIINLMTTIRDLFGVEAGTLYRCDRPAQQLVFEVVLGPDQESLYQQRLPIDRGIAGWVVRNGEPLLIPNVRNDVRFEGMFDQQSGFQTRSVLCVPLIARGEVCGLIQLINKLNGEFHERDLLLLRILASMGALVMTADAELREYGLGG